jgi:hypothetical protein
MKVIFAFMVLTLLAYPDNATAEAAIRNPLCCAICGAPHGNLIATASASTATSANST